jgi:hypothetical protein
LYVGAWKLLVDFGLKNHCEEINFNVHLMFQTVQWAWWWSITFEKRTFFAYLCVQTSLLWRRAVFSFSHFFSMIHSLLCWEIKWKLNPFFFLKGVWRWSVKFGKVTVLRQASNVLEKWGNKKWKFYVMYCSLQKMIKQ